MTVDPVLEKGPARFKKHALEQWMKFEKRPY
jgi:hypothetical protein